MTILKDPSLDKIQSIIQLVKIKNNYWHLQLFKDQLKKDMKYYCWKIQLMNSHFNI
ncbi:unnamed protein product [Paramecium primaurelia]|uniref:Uncharacterized protein n=1 Tax=Paramecium primaurelia TaxID=5886 RepID=A0A8S1Q8G4_PARPR|nr:unnamed protein product [Paramecium primaurelia]